MMKKHTILILIPAALVVCALFTLQVAADPALDSMQTTDQYRQTIEAWRTSREQRLESPNGWLTLVGLEWLKDGENKVGSAVDNDIRLTGGPGYWGSVFLQGERLNFVSADTGNVTINGQFVKKTELIADINGEPTLIASGTVNFHVIFRGSYGLRIKDSEAVTLKQFNGVDNYAIQQDWQIDGRFVRADEGITVEIPNVLGQINHTPVFGTFEFVREGKTHRLLALGDKNSKRLWFLFADRTSGRGTYGAGRFLYSDGMPENGSLTVDFNKAYNPPCTFNPYSTCPLPPQQNRMDLMVTAGEKDYHPASG